MRIFYTQIQSATIDVAGTSEAIVAALADIGNDDASIKVVASGVGGISESDANLALATEGFNVLLKKNYCHKNLWLN